MKINWLFICVLVFGLTAFGQKPAASPEAGKGPSYAEMAPKLQGGDTSVDYRALRIAYSSTKSAGPFGPNPAARSEMNKAFNEKRYKDAIKSADEILKEAYVNPNAHAVKSMAYRELGDELKADFHKAVYLGLVNSIISSGDGKTPETAFVVISTEEEYVVMRALGYSVGSQALQSANGYMFDVLSGTDEKTKQPVKMYFNIDIVWAMENRMFSPKN